MGFLKRLFTRENDEQVRQRQMNLLYRQFIEGIEVAMFQRLVEVVQQRHPDERADPIAANTKVYCTGEGENERSVQASTSAERDLARALADEIMARDEPGLYGTGDILQLASSIGNLPATEASIRRLALCYDQFATILILSLATDASNPMQPIINRQYLRKTALPLIESAERYDPNSSALQTTIAQVYYSLDDAERGFSHAWRARELDEENAEAWRLLGNGYLALGDLQNARICLERAFRIEPRLDGVQQALAVLSSLQSNQNSRMH